jgi:hypothetical protein
MAEATELHRERAPVTPLSSRETGRERPRAEDEHDRRARYLAKAASLGQMVTEDDSERGGC